MSASDLALVIGAGTGGFVAVVTCLGGLYLQLKTLKITQQGVALSAHNVEISQQGVAISADNSKKIDANTAVTEDAKAAAEARQVQVIAKVSEAKQIVAVAVDKIAGVDAKIDTVAESASASIERIAAAKLAEGIAVGHLAGIVAEQARATSATQQMLALKESPEGSG